MPATAAATRESQLPPVVRHLMLFAGCVVLPALFTAAAPLSVIHLDRAQSGAVVARTSTRVFFVIPYRQMVVENVTAISERLSDGSLNRSGFRASRRLVRTEDSAYLAIEGSSTGAEIEVSPANIDRVISRARAFLEASSEPHLRLVVVANWKFSVFAGGFLTCLTLLYLAGFLRSAYGRLRGAADRRAA